MFSNPNTIWIEVLVLILTAAFFALLIGIRIYKKKHNIPTGDCCECHKKKAKFLNDYHKVYPKN